MRSDFKRLIDNKSDRELQRVIAFARILNVVHTVILQRCIASRLFNVSGRSGGSD